MKNRLFFIFFLFLSGSTISFVSKILSGNDIDISASRELQGRNDPKGLWDKYEAHYQVRAAAGLWFVPMRGEKFIGGDGWKDQTVQ